VSDTKIDLSQNPAAQPGYASTDEGNTSKAVEAVPNDGAASEQANRVTASQANPKLVALSGSQPQNIDMLMDVGLQVTVELGRAHLTVRQVLDLQNGSVIELDQIAGEAVDIYVNDHILARGEVVVVDDKFGVRITELVSPNRDGDK
jgi:flagellar motor switch protein FliN